MATLLINTGRVPQQVGVILPNGKKSTTRIMGRSRGTLAPGVTVDPNWIALYGKSIKVVEQQPVISVAPVSVPAVATATTAAVVAPVTPVVAVKVFTPSAEVAAVAVEPESVTAKEGSK